MHEDDDGEGDWRENRRLVSSNFRQLFNRADAILAKMEEHSDDDRKRFEALSSEITALKTKAAIWGAIGGFLAAILAGIIVSKIKE